MGWALNPGTVAHHTVTVDGEQLYDATYTIGSDGLRISSPITHHGESRQQCILFFGGSFTFGQGVEDNQTLPYLINLNSKGKYRSYNFGVQGYGAHHMLSALQHGFVETTVDCDLSQVSHVFYQAILDHVRRAVGRIDTWSRHGPKYNLTEDGEFEFQGLFADSEGEIDIRSLKQRFIDQIARSMIYRSIGMDDYLSQYGENTIQFYLAIVEEARDVVRSKYPDAEFHVLLWDRNDIDSKQIVEGLREKRIALHLMSDILFGYQPDDPKSRYRLHERDAHPSSLAYELIARYLLSTILESGEPPSPRIPGTRATLAKP